MDGCFEMVEVSLRGEIRGVSLSGFVYNVCLELNGW